MPSCIFTKSGGGGGGDVGALTAPTDLSGLVVWFDFSDSTKIFDSNTGGSTPANGGAIGRIEDKSSNARNATQATANNRPTFQTNVQNGLSVARFDGTNDTLNTASFSMSQSISFFAVAARAWSTAAYAAIFASGNYANTSGYNLLTAGGTANEWKNKDIIFAGTGFNSTQLPRASGANALLNGFTSNTFHLFSGYIGSAATKIFIDKTEISYTYLLMDEDKTLDTTSTAFQIGSSATGDFWTRDIAEIFIYNSAISDTNRQKAENYLATKWGIA